MSSSIVYPPDVDVTVQGSFRAAKMQVPNDAIGNSQIDGLNPPQASKLQHQHAQRFSQAHGTAATTERRPVHVAHAAGSLLEVRASLSVACIGAAMIVIQVLKNGTNVLSSTFTLDNSLAAFASALGVFGTVNYVAGDVFEVSVTATAGGGTLGQGLIVATSFREAAD